MILLIGEGFVGAYSGFLGPFGVLWSHLDLKKVVLENGKILCFF